jgi:hypothetical protein
MKKTYFAVSLFLACCFLSLLIGSQQPRHLTASKKGDTVQQQPRHLTASKKGDTVQLCLSSELKCPQPEGVSPAGISVYRYDSLYDNEIVWETEPENPITNDRISGVITYGIPPKNWSNKIVPPALICGKAYLVNPGANFFALKCDGSVVVFDFQHLENFFRQEDPSEPTKKRPGSGGIPM